MLIRVQAVSRFSWVISNPAMDISLELDIDLHHIRVLLSQVSTCTHFESVSSPKAGAV